MQMNLARYNMLKSAYDQAIMLGYKQFTLLGMTYDMQYAMYLLEYYKPLIKEQPMRDNMPKPGLYQKEAEPQYLTEMEQLSLSPLQLFAMLVVSNTIGSSVALAFYFLLTH